MSEYLKVREEVVIADLPDGEVVASVGDRSTAVVLNATAGAILELCDGTRSIADIAGVVCECVQGSDPDTVRADVARMLDELARAGLLM